MSRTIQCGSTGFGLGIRIVAERDRHLHRFDVGFLRPSYKQYGKHGDLEAASITRKVIIAKAFEWRFCGPLAKTYVRLASHGATVGATLNATASHGLTWFWRRRPDLNRGWRFCRPLPYHLATAPAGTVYEDRSGRV
jgi:hypothetical protein